MSRSGKGQIDIWTTLAWACLQVLLIPSRVSCMSKPELSCRSFSRRAALRHALRIGTSATGSYSVAILLVDPHSAHAARGAFELDSEYYIRNFLGGNKKEGSINPSKPPELPPPRTLQGPLLPLLMNNDFSPSCIPVEALVEQILKQPGTNKDSASVAKDVAVKATIYRQKASRSFATRAQWNQDDVKDQYYFDLSAYALWKAAAELLPDYVQRDIYARNIGRLLFKTMKETSLLELSLQSAPGKIGLVDSLQTIDQILNIFQTSNFCKSYRIGNDQASGRSFKTQNKKRQLSASKDDVLVEVFDELDDEAIKRGASVDFLVSIYEPAVLGANLQITGEQSRFSPDMVGSTLAAYWESIGIGASWEVFFVDQEYRPNPKDYYPNEKLLQLTLTAI